jgi:hypothetical protein
MPPGTPYACFPCSENYRESVSNDGHFTLDAETLFFLVSPHVLKSGY